MSLFEQAVVDEKAAQAKERKTTRWVQFSVNKTANPWKLAAFQLTGKVNVEVPLPYGPLDVWHLNPTTNLNQVRLLDLRIVFSPNASTPGHEIGVGFTHGGYSLLLSNDKKMPA